MNHNERDINDDNDDDGDEHDDVLYKIIKVSINNNSNITKKLT